MPKPITKKRKKKEQERDIRFMQVVDKARSPITKKLRLCVQTKLSPDGESHLRKYLRRFEELEVSYEYSLAFRRGYHYNKMTILKLIGTCLGSVESCLFPKLRVLHLLSVRFEDKEGGSLENFLSACPVLEELVVKNLRFYAHDDMRICVPTLTSLVLQCLDDDYGHISFQFVLETPMLEYLTLRYRPSSDSLVTAHLCNLIKADITCLVLEPDLSDGSRVMKLLTKMSSVKFLKLSCKKMTHDFDRWFTDWHGLVDNFDYSCFDEFPVFDNLVCLELCIPSCDCVLVPQLLQKFHNLKHIRINKVFNIEEAEVCWKEPLQVPICLSSTLLSFCFRGFESFKVEVEFVQYVMKHAMVLKNVTIKSIFQGIRGKGSSHVQTAPGSKGI